MPCPDDDLVNRLLEGQADVVERAEVMAHIESCASCRVLLSEMAKVTITRSEVVAPEPGDGPLLRGTAVGRFVVLELIGAGAMGMVYAAYDPKLDRKIALKLLRPEASVEDVPLLRERLLREARAMARIAHPNIVTIHDVGESGDLVYIAMELVQGRSLRAWLAEARRPWRQVLEQYLRAGAGLAAAHQSGLVHRDFKPDNILLSDDGRVLVTDFGLATLDDVGHEARGAEGPTHDVMLTQTGIVLGTPAYMAPEQDRDAEVNARADIFAFAVSVWEGMHGQNPFPLDSVSSRLEAARLGAIRNPARHIVPARLRRALREAMNPDPALRPATLDELLRRLASRPARVVGKVALGVAALAVVALLVVAARAVIVARAETTRARARAEVARRLGEEVKEMELGLRAERLLPVHDLTPAETRVRARLDEMRAALTGDAADAPVHDALGRGLAALGEHGAARVELERALRLGADSPDLHFILGSVLAHLHADAVADARRMGGPTWAAQRRAALDAEFLPEARRHLELGRTARIAAPGLVEAWIAFEAGDHEAALAAARAAARAAPLFYEARVLAGAILEAQGQAAADRRDLPAAEALYLEATAELERAALAGSSDADVYDTLAGVWFRRLDLDRFDPDLAARTVLLAGALLATDRQIAVGPTRAAGYRRRAQLYFVTLAGGARDTSVFRRLRQACIAAAGAALEREPDDPMALLMRGDCLRQLVNITGERELLPPAIEALDAALQSSPGFPWAANDLCLAQRTRAAFLVLDGKDPSPEVTGAMASCQLAIRLDPTYAFPWNTIAGVYVTQIEAQLDRGVWDASAEVRAREALRNNYAMHAGGPSLTRINLLPLAAYRLRYTVELGRDPSAALAAMREALAAVEEILPPERRQGEALFMMLEARTEAALAAGDPVQAIATARACVQGEPTRFACRLDELRAAWRAGSRGAGSRGAPGRAQALARDFPTSARAWTALAEDELRAGDAAATARGLAAAVTAVALSPGYPAAQAMRGRLAWQAARDATDPALRARLATAAVAAFGAAAARNPSFAWRLEPERAQAIAALADLNERARSR